MVEREAGDAAAERGLLAEGIRRFPYFWKLHLMLGQLEERLGGWAGGWLLWEDQQSSCTARCCVCAHPAHPADSSIPRLPALSAAGNTDAARLAYAGGIKRCLDSIPLWVAAARLEERAGNVAKARALLEQVSPGCGCCTAPMPALLNPAAQTAT